MIEPVISERGYIPTPAGFIAGLAERCREHGILFIADETQSGFGRTGKMFAIDAHDVDPDMLCMAKGIASGFPFACARHAQRRSTPPGASEARAVRPTATRSAAPQRWRPSTC